VYQEQYRKNVELNRVERNPLYQDQYQKIFREYRDQYRDQYRYRDPTQGR